MSINPQAPAMGSHSGRADLLAAYPTQTPLSPAASSSPTGRHFDPFSLPALNLLKVRGGFFSGCPQCLIDGTFQFFLVLQELHRLQWRTAGDVELTQVQIGDVNGVAFLVAAQ